MRGLSVFNATNPDVPMFVCEQDSARNYIWSTGRLSKVAFRQISPVGGHSCLVESVLVSTTQTRQTVVRKTVPQRLLSE